MPPSCSPVPGHAHAPLSSAQHLPCSKGKGSSAEDAGVLGVFSGFLEMRGWDLLVHRLPWGAMHVVFIRRAVNCTGACKPVSQMLLGMAGILVHPSGPSRAVVPHLGAVPPGHHAGQGQPSAVTRRHPDILVPYVTHLWPPGSAGLSGRATGDFP